MFREGLQRDAAGALVERREIGNTRHFLGITGGIVPTRGYTDTYVNVSAGLARTVGVDLPSAGCGLGGVGWYGWSEYWSKLGKTR